ncbi:MAG: DinB family protein [Nitrososphaerales archaeon]
MPKNTYVPSVEYYRRLFRYNKKILDEYFRALSKLPWKTVSKNMESGHYSMKETFVHILTAYNGWLNYNLYGRSKDIPHTTEHNPDNYHSMKQIGRFKDKVWTGVEKMLSNLDDKMLQKRLKAPWLPGSYKLGDVMLQASFEEAHHIGEIIAMLWQLDIEPPEMTWMMTTRKFKD